MSTSHDFRGDVVGERDSLVTWLLDIAGGCGSAGSDGLRTLAHLAAVQLASGAVSARAGHTVYRVED